MAKVLNPNEVLASFYPRTEARFERSADGTYWNVTPAPGRTPTQVTEPDLAQMLFGPAPETSPLPHSEFPLPLWFWGLDAV
jgi:hypothetical protein